MASFDYPLFPIFAFFGFFLPLVPLPWHFKAGNSGTCFYIFWASISSLNQFVNSIVWRGNVINWAPVWCDISIRITMAATVGVPASSFCIVRRLYGIAAIRTVSITHAEKRRTILIDSICCGLFPALYLALLYIFQGHRFNIYEDVGCMPAIYNTIPSQIMAYSLPLLFGAVSAVYCTLSLRAFARRRLEFARFVSGNNKGLSIGQYLRLMGLAVTEMCCTIPLSIFMIWLSATRSPVSPWVSFANTHVDFSRVDQIPSVIYNLNPLSVLGILLTRWASVVCALIFFVFFGFAEEARRHYVLWGRAVLRVHRTRSTLSDASNKKGAKLPGPPAYQNNALSGLELTGNGHGKRETPFNRNEVRILDLDLRSTICFPDDDVELGPFKSISPSSESFSSPSSSSCAYSPRTAVTPSAPPSYVDSAYIDAAAVVLSTTNTSNSRLRTTSAEVEDNLSIADASPIPQPASLSAIRTPTPIHPIPAEMPVRPPAAMIFHRPFSPPHLYPVTQPHTTRTQNLSDRM